MIDFHNVLEVNGYVPDQHIEAIQELLGLGHEVVVCSYAFAKREKEVMRTLQSLPFWGQLSNAFCIRQRTGRWGKSSWAVHLGCTALFDDGADICQEAAWLNLRTFPIKRSTTGQRLRASRSAATCRRQFRHSCRTLEKEQEKTTLEIGTSLQPTTLETGDSPTNSTFEQGGTLGERGACFCSFCRHHCPIYNSCYSC